MLVSLPVRKPSTTMSHRSSSSSSQQPVPLLTLHNGKFVIGQDAIKVLSEVRGEIGIVAVAGLYRTGKSYLLNRLLGRQDGFAIGPSVNPCTKGIFIWGEPVKISRNGKEINLIFIDTEGIGSTQQNLTYDAKILSLALLLSSYFIYNSVGIIDEHAIDKLGLVVNITQNIHVRAHTGKADPAELAAYFPSFLWVLRDFSLILEDEKSGKEITAQQYLENALREIPGSEQTDKNEIRRKLKQLFVARDCVTLVRPVSDEKSLQQIDKMPWSKLRPEFRKAIEELQSKVFAEVPVKKVFDKPIDGKGLVVLIQNYVEAINRGSIPTIHSAWENVANQENQRAFDEALKLFQQHLSVLDKQLPFDGETLKNLKKEKFKIVFECFDELALGENRQKYREKLENGIRAEWKHFSTKNEQLLEKQKLQLTEQLYHQHIETKLKNKQFDDVHELLDAWKLVKKEFFDATKNNGIAQNVFWDFYFIYNAYSIVQFFDQQKDRLQSKLDHQKKIYEELQQRFLQLEENKSKLEVQFVAATKDRDRERENNQRLENEINEAKTAILSLKKENASLKESVEHLNNELLNTQNARAKFESNERTLKQQLTQLDHKNKELTKDLENIQKEKDEIKRLLAKQQQLFSEKEEAINRITHEKREMGNSFKAIMDEKEKLQKQLEQLREQVEEWRRRYTEVDTHKQDLEKQNALRTKNEENLRKENKNLVDQVEKLKSEGNSTKQKLQEAYETIEQLRQELEQIKSETVQLKQQYEFKIASLEHNQHKLSQQIRSSKVNCTDSNDIQNNVITKANELIENRNAEDFTDDQSIDDNKENSEENVRPVRKLTKRMTKRNGLANRTQKQKDEGPEQNDQRTAHKRKREVDESKKESEGKEKRQRIENPQKVTKSELKRELTRLGIPLPPKEENKQFYVDLYLSQFD
jgi:hypothetical protein